MHLLTRDSEEHVVTDLEVGGVGVDYIVTAARISNWLQHNILFWNEVSAAAMSGVGLSGYAESGSPFINPIAQTSYWVQDCSQVAQPTTVTYGEASVSTITVTGVSASVGDLVTGVCALSDDPPTVDWSNSDLIEIKQADDGGAITCSIASANDTDASSYQIDNSGTQAMTASIIVFVGTGETNESQLATATFTMTAFAPNIDVTTAAAGGAMMSTMMQQG